MSKGWIALHREIQNHWLWEDRPFTRGQAWIDLLMLVSHLDKKKINGNTLTKVESGYVSVSYRQLAERWGWSTKKVSSFLLLLASDDMVSVHAESSGTTIKVNNYFDYQKKIKKPSGYRRTATNRSIANECTRDLDKRGYDEEFVKKLYQN